MKRFTKILFSSALTFWLLLILAIVMGAATFIEDKYDTLTAKLVVYNAKWFELLFILLIINLVGHIIRFRLFRKEKLAVLLFHLALVVMIIGAGVTRYFGFEGSMSIREGQSSNIIYSYDPYLIIETPKEKKEIPVYISPLVKNDFKIKSELDDNNIVEVKYKDFIPNAIEAIDENVEDGKSILELTIANKSGRQKIYITEGETKNIHNIIIAYNKETSGAINIKTENGLLKIATPFTIVRSNMNGTSLDTIAANTTTDFRENYIYNSKNGVFLFNKYYKKAKKKLISNPDGTKSVDALIVDISINNKTEEAAVYGGARYMARLQTYEVGGSTVKLGYGLRTVELPFSIYLRDFTLDRYAGSMSPSSYESDITLIDDRVNLKKDYKIFMNNVLDYGGYRFFQSSYDSDEKGTVLSVNHDLPGTWISYIGYILLTLGFVITIFVKNSRFMELRRRIIKIRTDRKAGIITVALILLTSLQGFGQNRAEKHINAEHAEKFGHLIVQEHSGRFKPVYSFAYDVLHKVSRKDEFEVEGQKINAMQAYLDMVIHPEFWKEQDIIYIREKSVRDVLGIDKKYARFTDFFDETGKYRLTEFAEEAFRKKQSEQNKFDKEIIKVDERVNIFLSTVRANNLKIFPLQNSENNKWVSWEEKEARIPLTGGLKVLNDDLQLPVLNYSNIMSLYLNSVYEAAQSGDFSKPDKIVSYIESIQRQSSAKDIIPSETKVNVEVHYTKAQIFILLKNVYAGLSMVLLLLAFIDNLRARKSKIISILLNIFIVVLAIAFLYHTYGLILRWYLTGHAPWSNGYETLLFVAWGGLLSGFVFARNSKITLASTTLLAFFVLMTASHSSYDPQLTNLVPVLKSYWLIIHVATLTISYGFLGSGFILGIINLISYLFKTTKNYKRLSTTIKELTYINEMNLALGIILATVGTFLGGVWANESWGRYWGWDAKETWALVIVITYAIVLHFRFVPKLKSLLVFNIGSVLAFGSVIMTFVGVNYYLSKGMHSYAQGDTPIFPVWAWIIILSLILLMIIAGIKESILKKKIAEENG